MSFSEADATTATGATGAVACTFLDLDLEIPGTHAFNAVAGPNRRRPPEALCEGPRTVSTLVETIGQPRDERLAMLGWWLTTNRGSAPSRWA